jgi:hypothetical protein
MDSLMAVMDGRMVITIVLATCLSKIMDRGYGSKIKLFLAQLLVTIYLQQ